MVLVFKDRCFTDFKDPEVVSGIKWQVKNINQKTYLGLIFNSKNYMVDLRSQSYVL